MNYLNLFKNSTAPLRSSSFFSMILLAGLLAVARPLRADNPPTYLFSWGGQGTGNGQFNDPFGIAVDSSNNVYVVDSGNSRVEKFDRNGNYLRQLGSIGGGNGQFQVPQGIAVDAGVIWTKTGLPAKNWNSVAESADGTKMVALANSGFATFGIGIGGIFTSTDSGATWVTNNVPSAAWTCAAMSADGNEIIATIGNPASAGEIYVFQTTPAPVLNLSASDNVISWIIPSLDFTLQQSPALLSWTDVTNRPALNLTNLQNQVTLPPLDGSSFFRLKH